MNPQVRVRIEAVACEVDEILTRGATADDVARLAQLTAELEAFNQSTKVADLSRPDDSPYSKALRKAGGGDVSDLPGEHKAGEWLAAELKALTGGGVTGGGAFTPTDYQTAFFDLLAANSVALESGLSVITTDRGEVIIPRLTADPAASWTAEGAAITPSDPTADQVTATPRKLAALTVMSNEVIADANPSVLDVVGQQLARALGLRLDLGVFEGSGTAPEVRGLKNTTGVQTVSMGANGGAVTSLDPFADAIGLLEQSNARATAVAMHPRTWQALLKLKEETGSVKPLLQESAGAGTQGVARSIYGVPVFLTSQLSTTETQGTAVNASSAYVFESTRVVLVRREDVSVELDRSRLFNSDQSELRAIVRADVVVPTPAAVVRIVGIIP